MKVILENDGGYSGLDTAIGKTFDCYPIYDRPDLIKIKASQLFDYNPDYLNNDGCLSFSLKYEVRVIEL